MEGFAVYILASARNGTLYVGVTSDLHRRMGEHRSGAVPGFTRTYGVYRLVHVQFFQSLDDARTQERRLKRGNRAWKLALIERDNPGWRDLAEDLLR
ncbi:GIY-YIG nuclease family protein [Roseixanthobacter liquoris]|uniref:GIY-YIG nuclease family protein n=1 Tax=Roseixanthobacter liquoris TaxID=3119921 RepID=UPI00372C506F